MELPPVAQEQQHPVTGTEPEPAERGGQAGRAVAHLRPGQFHPVGSDAVPQRDLVGHRLHVPQQPAGDDLTLDLPGQFTCIPCHARPPG